MMPASTDNIESACEWVMAIRPSGMTHTDVALQEAFEFADKVKRGRTGSGYVVFESNLEVDTIFLVTDGEPTHTGYPHGAPRESPRGKAWLAKNQILLDSIYAMVEKACDEKKIMINCIGILPKEPSEFLENLAAKTLGTVVYVDPKTNKAQNPKSHNKP